MRWSVFRGLWDRWFKDENREQKQWFKELETFLSRAFRNRISLRDNLFCEIIEQKNVIPNSQIRLENFTRFQIEGALILKTTETGALLWNQEDSDFVFEFLTTAPSVETLKLCIFLRGLS